MKVFKFGGASIKDAEGVKNVANIIHAYGDKPLMVIISASGKTTNALEEVASTYFAQNGEHKKHLESIKKYHYDLCVGLFPTEHAVYDALENQFVELEWQLEEDRMESYNYVYDQIVSCGELFSSIILSHYLNYVDIHNEWLDVRDVLKTDDTYREAVVDWPQTDALIKSKAIPMLQNAGIVVTQGFLGCTPENCTTTLGREGSDYTAAIFANALDAESQSVWKDVPGILNGDPRLWSDAVLIENMTYHEAIEMTFYGAQVIHPKTIKPLQNKNIPLLVRSFIHPEDRGTKIFSAEKEPEYPPVRVIKQNQALIHLHTKDFSFVEEVVMSKIIKAFAKANLKLNMMQNAAILFQGVVDNDAQKLTILVQDLERFFDIKIDKNLTLLTIRHYNDAVIKNSIGDKKAILEQKRATTFQALLQ
jgi:aspartate kinase